MLLADRARFPRDKPCGGGRDRDGPYASCRAPSTPSSRTSCGRSRCASATGSASSGGREAARPDDPAAAARRLPGRAGGGGRSGLSRRRHGRRSNDGTGRSGAHRRRQRVQAPAIVGADGVNGTVARAAGLGGGIVYGIALEGNGPLQAGQQGRATVELGVVPGGYGWVFPKDGHANYGVGGWASEGPRLREHLRRLCDAARRRPAPADRPARPPSPDSADERGARAARSSSSATPPVSSTRSRVTASTRRSSPLASLPPRSSRAGSTTTRTSSTRRSAATPRRRGRRSSCSTVIPRAAFAIARLPAVWRVIAGLVCGDLTHPSDARGFARPPLRLLARL